MVTKLFPGKDTDFRLLLNEKATQRALLDIIDVDIPELPRYSSIIFYFAGHGSRNILNKKYKEDVRLVLSGATATNLGRDSIKLRYLIDALASTQMASGMVFLDACYSGTLDDYESDHPGALNDFGERFVLFTSSGPNETTYSGAFTKALISQWRVLSSGGACVRPRALTRAIQAELNRDPMLGMGMQTAMMLPGSSKDRCFANVGRPSSFVVLAPAPGIAGRIQVQFDDEPPDNFRPESEKLYVRLMPKEHTVLSVGFAGQNSKLDILPSNLEKDLVVISISPDSSMKVVSWDDPSVLSDDQLYSIAERAIAKIGADTSLDPLFQKALDRAYATGDSARVSRYCSISGSSVRLPKGVTSPQFLDQWLGGFHDERAIAAASPASDNDDTVQQLRKDLQSTEDKLATALRGYALLQRSRETEAAGVALSTSSIAIERDKLAGQVEALTKEISDLKTLTAAQAAKDKQEIDRVTELVKIYQRSNEKVNADLAVSSNLLAQLRGANTILANENYKLRILPAAASVDSSAIPKIATASGNPPKTHIVADGDSLSKISQRYYGTPTRWQEIFQANRDKIGNSGVLRVGLELRIP